ncbi:MAG: hypothetical protein ACFE8U_11810 [Candidatus Hermodarchaeota archaeon]
MSQKFVIPGSTLTQEQLAATVELLNYNGPVFTSPRIKEEKDTTKTIEKTAF